ncbi:MAG: dihydroorotate dehydrogenase electron transfer subunit [Oscillospiraceae bacterium]
MAENALYTVQSNTCIAKDVYHMRVTGPTGSIRAPGQFVNIKLDGFYLRRPISISDWDAEGMDLIYKIMGKGTAQMAGFEKGRVLDMLAGLGNGFNIRKAAGKKVVIVGGGVGLPPLYGLAKWLISTGNTPKLLAGFRGAGDVFYMEEFEKLGCEICLDTEDGSAGEKGFVTAPMCASAFDYYFACGPLPMLKAVKELGQQMGVEGQLSLEARMGCGMGACMGCTCKTETGPKRVCLEGPVFTSQEVQL